MKAISARSVIAKLEKIKVQLAKSRDELREIQSEVEMFLESKDDEIQDLESIIDSLSRYV